MVFVPPYYGPNPNPGPCSDRRHHNYDNPCTQVTKLIGSNCPLPGPARLRPLAHYDKTNCTNANHDDPFTVCGNCVEMTEHSKWYTMAKKRMVEAPPEAGDETTRWRGFWTRLCRLCEHREQFLWHERQGHIGLAIAAPPNSNATQQYPDNTCTCVAELTPPGKRCAPHWKDYWDLTRPPLVAARIANREWLRTVARDAAGVLCRASNARLLARWTNLNNTYYRGCRCGRDIQSNLVPLVYLCMACEGIWQVTQMAVGHIYVQHVGSSVCAGPMALPKPSLDMTQLLMLFLVLLGSVSSRIYCSATYQWHHSRSGSSG